MEKIIRILIFIISIAIFSNCFIINSLAKDYYKNNNGISFSKEEYEFLSKMYWDGYQKNMTLEDYIDSRDSNIMNGEFKSKTIYYDNNNIMRGTSHSTANKTLKIAASCSSNCRVSIVLTWLNNPTIRSYDVIGARFSEVKLQSTPVTRVESSSSSSFSNNIKELSNGFGTSILLPSGSNIILNQDYYVTKGGTIYASYQHARKKTTLSISQMFDISPSGYGRVFSFYNSAADVYDAMNGVDLSV